MSNDTNGIDKLRETANKLKKLTDKDKAVKSEIKKSAMLDLKKLASVGMQKVDPLDVKPPRVILVQNIKDKSELKDKSGKECPEGQFFNDGNNEIFEKLDCYILYASKGTHVNKRHLDWGELPKYDAIGMKIDDGQLFAITFKNTGRNALSKLFTANKVQGYPMFSFKCSLETKLINGADKSGEPLQWWIPVVRVGDIETDEKKLRKASEIAISLDARSGINFDEADEETEVLGVVKEVKVEEVAEVLGVEENKEVEEKDDIPF